MKSAKKKKKYSHDFFITITLQVRSYRWGATGYWSLIHVQACEERKRGRDLSACFSSFTLTFQ